MPQDLLSIDDLLEQMVARGASDLHLSAGAPPTLRVRGEMIRLEELGKLMPADTQQLLHRRHRCPPPAPRAGPAGVQGACQERPASARGAAAAE